MSDPAPSGGSGTVWRPPVLCLQRDVAGESRFWAWRENVSCLWDIAVEHPSLLHRFHARSQVHHLGRGILARTAAAAHRLRRTPTAIARFGVDHILLQLRLRGVQHGRTPTSELVARPGDVTVIDMAQPFAAATTSYKAITMALPRGLLAPLLRDEGKLHGLVLPGSTPMGRLLASHLVALEEVALGLTAADAASAATGTAALAAACCGPAMALRDGTPDRLGPAVLLAIRRHIDANPASPEMTADALALRFGLSRSALYRLFNPLGGVAEYIRGRRLAYAYARLTQARQGDAAVRITVLAYDCGFESESAFSRAFSREYGISPREARVAADPVPVPVTMDGSPGAVLHRWMVGLVAP